MSSSALQYAYRCAEGERRQLVYGLRRRGPTRSRASRVARRAPGLTRERSRTRAHEQRESDRQQQLRRRAAGPADVSGLATGRWWCALALSDRGATLAARGGCWSDGRAQVEDRADAATGLHCGQMLIRGRRRDSVLRFRRSARVCSLRTEPAT